MLEVRNSERSSKEKDSSATADLQLCRWIDEGVAVPGLLSMGPVCVKSVRAEWAKASSKVFSRKPYVDLSLE